jgi:hypothetical protein
VSDYSPITPPPELVQQWASEWMQLQNVNRDNFMATRAAQWGSDQELEACCEWLHDTCVEDPEDIVPELRTARRPEPKPPSLKEQALEMLENTWKGGHISNNAAQTIRRALEQLPDNE